MVRAHHAKEHCPDMHTVKRLKTQLVIVNTKSGPIFIEARRHSATRCWLQTWFLSVALELQCVDSTKTRIGQCIRCACGHTMHAMPRARVYLQQDLNSPRPSEGTNEPGEGVHTYPP